jgi:predicted nucleic acid-binding protein
MCLTWLASTTRHWPGSIPANAAPSLLGSCLGGDLILIEERKGSAAAAVSKGFETTGTLGILDLAAKRKLIELREAVERRKQTNFRYRKDLIEHLLAQHEDRVS